MKSLFVVGLCIAFSCIQQSYQWSLNNNLKLRATNNQLKLSKALRNGVLTTVASFSLLGNPLPILAGATPTIESTEQQRIKLFQDNTPSVVFINTFVSRVNGYTMNAEEFPSGTGSGFVWDDEGHIVTNYHVIRNAQSATVTVTGMDGISSKTLKAEIVGVDPDKDIAVLCAKSDKPINWKRIQVGSSKDLKVGQSALAIGNPFGLDHTLTTGIISGLGRQVRSPSNRPISNVIQTDAAINPGNSGGPLLDSQGRLIGMNTAIFSPSGASAGIGFAIPVDTLSYEVNTLIREGKVVRPALGVSYLDSAQSKQLGIERGILVLETPADSPASRAGVQSTRRNNNGDIILGDIIVGMNNDMINNESDLFRAIEKHKVGEVVSLSVLRQRENISNSGSTTRLDNNDEYTRIGNVIVRKPVEVTLSVTLGEAVPQT